MKKARLILAFAGIFLMIGSILFSSLHLLYISRLIIVCSLLCFLVCVIINLFIPRNKVVKAATDSLSRTTNILINLGCICMLSGAGLRLFRIEGFRYLYFGGSALILIAMTILGFLIQRGKALARQKNKLEVSDAILAKYAGIYSNEQLNMRMTITAEGSALTGQVAGQSSFPLNAIKENVFNYLKWRLVIEFYPEKNELILIQHGGYYPFVREN